MCETSGSCAVPKQSYILDRLPAVQQNNEQENKVVINEPKKEIDPTKQVCFYA